MVKKLYIHWMLPTIIMVLLLLTIATNNCFADEELRTYGHFRYVVNNNEITIKDYGYDYLSNPYEDELLTIRIPSVIDGIHVTRVSKEIFFKVFSSSMAKILAVYSASESALWKGMSFSIPLSSMALSRDFLDLPSSKQRL